MKVNRRKGGTQRSSCAGFKRGLEIDPDPFMGAFIAGLATQLNPRIRFPCVSGCREPSLTVLLVAIALSSHGPLRGKLGRERQ